MLKEFEHKGCRLKATGDINGLSLNFQGSGIDFTAAYGYKYPKTFLDSLATILKRPESPSQKIIFPGSPSECWVLGVRKPDGLWLRLYLSLTRPSTSSGYMLDMRETEVTKLIDEINLFMTV